MDTHAPSRSHAVASFDSRDSAPLTRGGPQDGGAAFGQFLRRVREQRGLTLQQIASETKIPQRHLDALEHGNLAVIPHPIYQRAEIRAYAKTVGLDPNVALAELERASRVPETPKVHTKVLEVRSVIRAAVLVIAGLATGAVSGFAVWNGNPVSDRRLNPIATASGLHDAVRDIAQTPRDVRLASNADRDATVDTPSLDTRAPATAHNNTYTASLASVQADGELAVTTDPAGARVTVNGVGWGVTPVTIRHLTLGEKRVRATMQGYATEEHVVNLTTKKPRATLHILLTAR